MINQEKSKNPYVTVAVMPKTKAELRELKKIFAKPSIDALVQELITIAKYQVVREHFEKNC